VRVALGAGRARIVLQLFVEALVLASVAAAVGVAAAWGALRTVMGAVGEEDGGLPFWWDFDLSAGTVLYAASLAVLGAVIAGVVPALKVTQGGVQARLRQAAAGGSSLRFGRLWTGIIVGQVALSVAVLPVLVAQGWTALRDQAAGPGVAAHEYLSAELSVERGVPPSAAAEAYEARLAATFAERRRELARRLSAEPGVTAVTYASALPGMGHATLNVVPEGTGAGGAPAEHAVRTAVVDPEFFDAFDAPIVAGRGFHAGDLAPGRDAAIVNRSFVRLVLGGRDPIGARVREVPRPGQGAARTYQIVGVVPDLGMSMEGPDQGAGLYRPTAPGASDAVRIAVRVDGRTPASLSARLRDIALAVDPTLRVDELRPLDAVGRAERMGVRLLALVVALLAVVALLLSSAGIYAMMAFAVSQRTREIGIRAALGAHPGRIVKAIFGRALGQLAAGVVVGAACGAALVVVGLGASLGVSEAALMVGAAAFVVAVGLGACAVPARRALRIQPTEALRQPG
jgi:putative ABC transport system permease protein